MPAAVRRDNENGITQDWYSDWIAKSDSRKSYTTPLNETLNQALPSDTITVCSMKIDKSLAPLEKN